MNAVTSIWRQLVRRRLWPVAVLLIAALAAVPVLLTREPEPVAAVVDPVPALSQKADTIAEPVVAKVAAGDRDRRRRVLGARKDPFEPAPVKAPKAEKAEKAEKADATADVAPDAGSPGSSAPSLPTEPAPAPFVYPADSLTIRFGDAEADQLAKGVLTKLEALPDVETPLLVYLGLTANGKKAKFLVDDALEVTGDGMCKPHPTSCETVELAAGETEFFDQIDPITGEILGTLQLDIVKIHRKS